MEDVVPWFEKHSVLKKGLDFPKGWTPGTPAETDGWVFQKIVP